MTYIEHLRADLFGLNDLERAALSGKLQARGIVTRAADVCAIDDPFLPAERAELARWLEARAATYAPHVAVLESIRSLQEPGASCVICEAPPAILGGSLESFHGVLQTLVLARELSTQGAPVVPVLWVLSDAHETAPLISARVVNRYHELQTVQLEELGRGRTPLQRIQLKPERHGLGALRAVLSQLFGDYTHIDPSLDCLLPSAGETLPGAFIRAMYDLFGSSGLVIIEPEDLREELSRAVADLVSHPLAERLEQSGDALDREFHGNPNLDRPWLYHLAPGGRRPLFSAGEGFRLEGEPGSRTPAELAAELVQDPRNWHAGVWLDALTRPMVLPTLLEVGGHAGLERHLLLEPLRRRFEWPTPGFVPRVQVTLVDPPCRDSLTRLGVELAGVLLASEPQATLDGSPESSQLLASLEKLSQETLSQLRQLRPAVVDLDERLARALRSATREVSGAFETLNRKVSNVHSGRGGRQQRHLRRLSSELRPEQGPQGKTLTPFPWIARYGRDWIDEFTREMDPFCGEHVVLHLD